MVSVKTITIIILISNIVIRMQLKGLILTAWSDEFEQLNENCSLFIKKKNVNYLFKEREKYFIF